MRKSAQYVLLGVLLYLLFLIATFPAGWIAEAVTRLSNGQVSLAAARGTFWSGTGELYAGGSANSLRSLGTLNWSVNPLWLFALKAQLGVQLEGPTARGQATVRVGHKHMSAYDLSATLAAPVIALFYSPAAFFAPTGTIDVKAPSIELSSAGLVGNLEAQWRGAGARFTGQNPLGDYRMELIGRGETATMNVTTLGGSLDISGQGQWHVTGEGDFQFTGSASPRGDPGQLEPLLKLMGPDTGGGRREIRMNTRVSVVKQLGF